MISINQCLKVVPHPAGWESNPDANHGHKRFERKNEKKEGKDQESIQ